MKGDLRGRGTNSISNFHHHNINGGSVSTIHDVTGQKPCKGNLHHEISMLGVDTHHGLHVYKDTKTDLEHLK
jgi:hypothetical protein